MVSSRTYDKTIPPTVHVSVVWNCVDSNKRRLVHFSTHRDTLHLMVCERLCRIVVVTLYNRETNNIRNSSVDTKKTVRQEEL